MCTFFPPGNGDGCMIMKVDEPEHPLSKIEVRWKRLERMKPDSAVLQLFPALFGGD